MKINFVTGNQYKFDSAARYFEKLEEYQLAQFSIDTPEIQANSSEEIARSSAIWAAQKKEEPCVKMDVSFHIEVFRGFPGPYVKQANEWFTADDFQRLLGTKFDRSAHFLLSLAIAWPNEESEAFTHKVEGRLDSRKLKRSTAWVIDSLFIPDGFDAPLVDLKKEQANQVWGDGPWPQLIEYLESKTRNKK